MEDPTSSFSDEPAKDPAEGESFTHSNTESLDGPFASPVGAVHTPGQQIDRYTIRELLGVGGFGIVYRAEQMQPIRRMVALKVLKPGIKENYPIGFLVASESIDCQPQFVNSDPCPHDLDEDGELTRNDIHLFIQQVQDMLPSAEPNGGGTHVCMDIALIIDQRAAGCLWVGFLEEVPVETGTITHMLDEVRNGVPGAQERLFERVYSELKAMAGRRMQTERPGDPALDCPTALVHEAYGRLSEEDFKNRRHLFFGYARAMRQILIDRARHERALKHGGGRRQVTLDEQAVAGRTPPLSVDALDIDRLLERLAVESPRQVEVVTLRYFAGLKDEDIAEVLGVDTRTVRRDWKATKARFREWLESSW
jgi:RNA polymerase sigma factor (TIGR02999 family)